MDFLFTNKCEHSVGSLRWRMNSLLFKRKTSDCQFHAGISRTHVFSAHRVLLATASPVFEVMFFGSIPPLVNEPIEINDIAAVDFRDLLRFIYTDDVEFSCYQKAVNLYYAAHKYMIEGLKELCIVYMMDNVNVNNVCPVLDLARLYEIKDLEKCCLKEIQTNAAVVLKSNKFLKLEISSLDIIVDQLMTATELELFQALERYAHYRIFSKKCLEVINLSNGNHNDDDNSVKSLESVEQTEFVKSFKAIVRKIRFLTMTSNEFAHGPAKSKLLTSQQAYSLLFCISDKANVHRLFPNGFNSSMIPRAFKKPFVSKQANVNNEFPKVFTPTPNPREFTKSFESDQRDRRSALKNSFDPAEIGVNIELSKDNNAIRNSCVLQINSVNVNIQIYSPK